MQVRKNKLKIVKIILGFVITVLAINVAILSYKNSTKPKNLESVLTKEYGEDKGEFYFNDINNNICDHVILYGYTVNSYNLSAPVLSDDEITLMCTLDNEQQLGVEYTIATGECVVYEVKEDEED